MLFRSSESDPREEVNSDVIVLEGYGEYYLGGKYSTLTATIDPIRYFGTSEYDGTQLEIVADDEVVYQSPGITYKTNNLDIKVNIKNADYIRFRAVYVGGAKFSQYYDADPILICNAVVSN